MGRFPRVDRCDWLEMNRLKPGSVLIRGGSREDGFPASGKNRGWKEARSRSRISKSRRHGEGMVVAGDDELPEEPSIIVINSAKMAVPGSNPGGLLSLR